MEDHTSTFKSFNILFDQEGSFTPGQEITGLVVFSAIRDVQLSPVRLCFRGVGTIYEPKSGTLIETVKYWDKTVDLGTHVMDYKGDQEHKIPFTETLPTNLETSAECRSLTIVYSVKARFTYRTLRNEVQPLCTVRGFTVILPVHLDHVDAQKFKPSSYSVTKNYGYYFLCTWGQINLKLNLERNAFLCGESIVMEGNLKNDSSRRVETVKAVLEKMITVFTISTSPPKLGFSSYDKPSLTPISTEILKVKEETLAMFADPHSTTKISRNFAAPTVRPSSFENIQLGRFAVSVSYRIVVKVQQVGICNLSVCIPTVFGTVRHSTCHNKRVYNPWLDSDPTLSAEQDDQERQVHYQRDSSERPSSLFESEEYYLTNRTRITHCNVYPCFPNLPSSSKQSRQFKLLAGAVKAENLFMSNLRSANQLASKGEEMGQKPSNERKAHNERPADTIVMIPENLLIVQPYGQRSPSSQTSWPSSRWTKSSGERRKSSLPPVEISITD